MPRYYFRLVDSLNTEMKKEGLELPDNHTAWDEATTSCGELLEDLEGRLTPATNGK
jgi:hypothetical protein